MCKSPTVYVISDIYESLCLLQRCVDDVYVSPTTSIVSGVDDVYTSSSTYTISGVDEVCM